MTESATTHGMDETTLQMRREVVWDSDTVCEGCGADPKANEGEAINDPAWFIDGIVLPAFHGLTAYYELHGQARCPKCW